MHHRPSLPGRGLYSARKSLVGTVSPQSSCVVLKVLHALGHHGFVSVPLLIGDEINTALLPRPLTITC